jgi:hypothetical protein
MAHKRYVKKIGESLLKGLIMSKKSRNFTASFKLPNASGESNSGSHLTKSLVKILRIQDSYVLDGLIVPSSPCSSDVVMSECIVAT